MKIVLLGNIGVGKSSLAEYIKNKYSIAEYLSIDNIRCLYGNGSVEKELLCKELFINSIKIDKSFQIIELSGRGILGENLFKKLNNINCPILVVYLYASIECILNRIKDREWQIPIPYTGGNMVMDAIHFVQNAYNNGLLNNLLNHCRSIICISLNNEQENIERNYMLITKIIDDIMLLK